MVLHITGFSEYSSALTLFCGLKKKGCFGHKKKVIVVNEHGTQQEQQRAGVPFFHLLYMQELIGFYATEISFPLVFMCLTTNCLSLSLIKCALNNTQL